MKISSVPLSRFSSDSTLTYQFNDATWSKSNQPSRFLRYGRNVLQFHLFRFEVIATKYSRRSSLRFRLVQITWLTTPSLIYQEINGKGYRWCNCFYVCCDGCNWTWILGHLKDSNRSNFNVRTFFYTSSNLCPTYCRWWNVLKNEKGTCTYI